MFKILVAISALGLIFFLSPSVALAHTLKSDGSVGAVMHLDPDDDPIIGQEANFFFEFKDTKGKFKPADCSCLVTISKENETFFSDYLLTNNGDPSLESASFSFTFPEKGVYQVKVTGKPSNESGFDNFELDFDLRVDREAGGVSSTGFVEQNIHFFLLGGILLVFLAIFFSKRIRKANPGSSVTPKIILLILLVASALVSHNTRLDQIVFFHHNQNHQESAHPCCIPQPIALLSSQLMIQPSSSISELLPNSNPTLVVIDRLTPSTRSPPPVV